MGFVRVGGTILLLTFVLLRIDLSTFPVQIARTGWVPLLPVLGLSYAAWIVNSYKWQRLLSALQLRYGLGNLFRLNLAATFYGIALPGQITGEVLKAVRLSRQTERRSAIFVSVFLDRLTGLIGLLLLGAAALLVAPPPGETSPAVWFFIFVLIASAVAGTLLIFVPYLPTTYLPSPLHALIEPLPTTHWRLAPTLVVTAVGLSMLFQAANSVADWLIAVALGLSISPLAMVWILAAVTVVQLLPISFAGLGAREATFVALLGLYGVDAVAALALSLIAFGVLLVLGVTGGVLDLTSRGSRSAVLPTQAK